MYELNAIKKVLGDDYKFHQSKTVDEVKRILATGEMEGNDTVAFVLEAGNLDIEINIDNFAMGVITEDRIETEPLSLSYFCCVRTDGEWESFEGIPCVVDLDVPDIEAEMFRVLDKFAELRGLSFFAENDHINPDRPLLDEKQFAPVKPLVSQNELIAKAEAAVEESNPERAKKSDKGSLLLGLENTPLSQMMIDFLYEKEDVAEEMLEFVKENWNYEDFGAFEYGSIDFTNMEEIAEHYVNTLENKLLSAQLYERAEKELSVFIEQLKTEIITPDIEINNDGICSRAYKLTVMNEMLCYMEGEENFDVDELRALLTLENPLDHLLDVWTDSDVSIKDGIIDVMRNSVDELMRSLEDTEPEFESEDEDEMEI